MPSMDDYLALAVQRGEYDKNVQKNSGKSWMSRAVNGALNGYGAGSGISSALSAIVGANVWNPLGWAGMGGMALYGALAKGKGASKSARTDYAKEDAHKIMQDVYRNELGREMVPGEWEKGIAGIGGPAKNRWLGSDGLKYWINQISSGPEAMAHRGQQPAQPPMQAGPVQASPVQAGPVQAGINERVASKLNDPNYAPPQMVR